MAGGLRVVLASVSEAIQLLGGMAGPSLGWIASPAARNDGSAKADDITDGPQITQILQIEGGALAQNQCNLCNPWFVVSRFVDWSTDYADFTD
jgi:hypothetical protein